MSASRKSMQTTPIARWVEGEERTVHSAYHGELFCLDLSRPESTEFDKWAVKFSIAPAAVVQIYNYYKNHEVPMPERFVTVAEFCERAGWHINDWSIWGNRSK